jgi:hypothetical protein
MPNDDVSAPPDDQPHLRQRAIVETVLFDESVEAALLVVMSEGGARNVVRCRVLAGGDGSHIGGGRE